MRIKLWGMCRHELMRVMCSWRFYISLLIYISIVFIAGHMDAVKNSTAESMLVVVTGVSNFDVVLFLTASFPFACSFCDDWNDRYINSVVIRSNVISYAAAKMVVCALTSFAVSFVGLMSVQEYGQSGTDVIFREHMGWRLVKEGSSMTLQRLRFRIWL